LVHHELDMYISDLPISRSAWPLDCWQKQQSTYPVARHLVAIPATSVATWASVRLFSRASDVITKKRNQLSVTLVCRWRYLSDGESVNQFFVQCRQCFIFLRYWSAIRISVLCDNQRWILSRGHFRKSVNRSITMYLIDFIKWIYVYWRYQFNVVLRYWIKRLIWYWSKIDNSWCWI